MNKGGTKTGLFLMELVVALLLFAFCAAICMQLFVAARERTRNSTKLSQSVYLATSAAECYKTSGGDLEAVMSVIAGGNISGNVLVSIPYIINGEAILLFVTDMGGIAEITVVEERDVTFDGEMTSAAGDTIYSITVKAVSAVA